MVDFEDKIDFDYGVKTHAGLTSVDKLSDTVDKKAIAVAEQKKKDKIDRIQGTGVDCTSAVVLSDKKQVAAGIDMVKTFLLISFKSRLLIRFL